MTISAKHSILDIWQGSDYASGLLKLFCCGSKRDTPENWYMTNIYIRFKLSIFPYSEVAYVSKTFKLKKRQSTMEFGVFCALFYFVHSTLSDNKCDEQKWYVLFLTCIKIVVHVLACARAINTSNEEDCHWVTKGKKCFNLF